MKHAWLTVFGLAALCAAAPTVSAGAAADPKASSRSAPFLEDSAAQAAGLTPQEIKDATKLYATKCMRCHKSYEPNAYSQAQWDLWMVKMRKKAKLTPNQENALTRYLDAYRASSPLAKTNSAVVR